MTTTIVLHPIIKALCAASTFLGIQNPAPHEWRPFNELQHQLIQQHEHSWNELSHFSDKELKGFASKDFKQLNEMLRKEGFSIQLDESLAKDDNFGAVSILDILLSWKYKGQETIVKSAHTDQHYPAVLMENDENYNGFCVFSSHNHDNPILRLKTKTGDVAWITIADKKLENMALLERIQEIGKGGLTKQHGYTQARFPMVNLDREEEISWLENMEHPTSGYFIAQALQQTKFKMNHEGAHVKSAVAIGFERLAMPAPSKKIVIDQPFYLWIERPGVSDPYFAAYICEENWQNPENLEL